MVKCEIETCPDGTSFVTPPNLTASIVESLRKDVDALIQDAPPVFTLDLGNTVMVDSDGIGLLITTYQRLKKKNSELRVVGVSPDIYQVLKGLRLTERINIQAAN